MNERVATLRELEPKHAGRSSYQAILETTAGLFHQFPAVDIALRDILSTSGVGNQTLYNYFPNGRDDIALVLQDRYLQAAVHAFHDLVEAADWASHQEGSAPLKLLSACLTKAVFTPINAQFVFHTSLHGYLKTHALLDLANHTDELAEAFQAEVARRLGRRIHAAELPRVAHQCAHLVRELADLAIERPDYVLEVLESNARLVVRSLLQTILKDQEIATAGIPIHAKSASGPSTPQAPISSQKRQSIFNRMLKRKKSS